MGAAPRCYFSTARTGSERAAKLKSLRERVHSRCRRPTMRLRRELSVRRIVERTSKLLRLALGRPLLPAKFLQLCDRFGRIVHVPRVPVADNERLEIKIRRGTSGLNDGEGFAQDRACLALIRK